MAELRFILNQPSFFAVTFSVVIGLGYALANYQRNGALATFLMFVSVAFFFETFVEYPKNLVLFFFYGLFFVVGVVLGGGLPRFSFPRLQDLLADRLLCRFKQSGSASDPPEVGSSQSKAEQAKSQFRQARREREETQKKPSSEQPPKHREKPKKDRARNSHHGWNSSQGSKQGYRERQSYQERLKQAAGSTRKSRSESRSDGAEQKRRKAQEQAREEVRRARAEKEAEEKKQRQQQQRAQQPNKPRSAMEVLGLQAGYTPDDLKTAYKQLRSRYHPDRFEHMSDTVKQEMAKEFQAVQDAYKKLK